MDTPHATSSIDGLHVVEQSGSSVINVGGTERLASAAIGFLLLRAGLRGGGLLTSIVGGYLLYRGASGNCPVYSQFGINTGNTILHKTDAVNIRTTIVVNKPRQEVYDFWRKLENLPRFMKHLETVTEMDGKRSHWEAKIPGGVGKLSWDAEVIKEENGS